MESLFLWVPVVFIFTLLGIGIFLWAVRSGQYDDLDRDGQRFLFDDDQDRKP